MQVMIRLPWKIILCSLFFWIQFEGMPLEHYFKPALNKEGIHAIPGLDFIYVINLDQRPEKFEAVFKELIPYGITPYRFSAVNGWELPLDVIHDVGLKLGQDGTRPGILATYYQEVNGKYEANHERLTRNGITYFSHCFSRGAIAICLSHLSVLQDAYNSGYETIWVMEDDIKVIKDPRIISSLIQELDKVAPGWDVFYTDRDTKDQNGIEVPCRAVCHRPNFDVKQASYYLKKNHSINQKFAYTSIRYGAYSMIVRREGMKKILDFFKTYKIFLPYDIDIGYVPKMKFVALKEEIVSTNPRALSDNGGPNYLSKD